MAETRKFARKMAFAEKRGEIPGGFQNIRSSSAHFTTEEEKKEEESFGWSRAAALASAEEKLFPGSVQVFIFA